MSAMLRIHCVQLFYNLSDPGMEDMLYEVELVRRFVGLRTIRPAAGRDGVPVQHVAGAADRRGRALRRADLGAIAGAGLDLVVNLSPPLDHKLIQLGNVLVTPHTAFFSQEAVLGWTRAGLS